MEKPVAIRSERILIVDDDHEMLDFLSQHLTLRGFETNTAASAGEAIELVCQKHFNLVICDLKMPLIDGITCLETITNLDPTLRVIMISGEATVEKAVSAMKKGACDFMQKPIQMDELFFRIDKALLKSQLESLLHRYEKSRPFSSRLAPQELLDSAIQVLARLFLAKEACWITIHDNHMMLLGSFGLDTEAKQNAALALAEQALENNETGFLTHETITVPLYMDRSLHALLVLRRPEKAKCFTLSDLREATQLGEGLLEAIENLKLFHSFQEKMTEFEKTYGELEESKNLAIQKEKLAQLGIKVADVAHEINNPLSAVMGYTDLLLHRPDIDNAIRNPLAIVFREAERCRNLLTDLLQNTQIRKQHFRKIYLQQIASETLEILALDFEKEHVEAHLKTPSNAPEVSADPDKLKQVLINLLKNASQAMTGQAEKHIEIEITGAQDAIRMTVSDNGPGIQPELQNKIFEPFFTTKKSGAGIGLSVCSEIIEQHHGKISVQSAPGKGTCFVVELPQHSSDFDTSLDHAA